MTAKKVSQKRKKKVQKKVNWGSSDAFYLRRSLAHVQQKLNRIAELSPRLEVEAPELTLSELVARLRKRKKQLVKEIAKTNRKSKKNMWTGFTFRPQTWESHLSGLNIIYKPFPGGVLAPMCSYHSGSSSKPRIDPYAYQRSWLNHGSTADYAVDDHYFDQYTTFLFDAELNDDAAWYRDDNPDWIEWGTEIGYSIRWPVMQKCSAIVTVEVSIRVISEFTNAADDGGSGFHSIAFAHTDPSGNWPAGVADVSSLQDIVLQLNSSGHYDSDWQKYTISFEVNRDVSAGLAVLLVTHLRAQDGKVETYGQWLASPRADYSFGPA